MDEGRENLQFYIAKRLIFKCIIRNFNTIEKGYFIFTEVFNLMDHVNQRRNLIQIYLVNIVIYILLSYFFFNNF